MSLADESSTSTALSDLRDDVTPTNWILLGYKAGGEDVHVLGTGAGGLSELVSRLAADAISYAVVAVNVKEADYSIRKFVFLSWVGPDTKPMLKARSSQHRLPLYKFANHILQLSAELQSQDIAEVTEDFFLEKLTMSKVKGEQDLATGDAAAKFHSSGGHTYGFSFEDASKAEEETKKLHTHDNNWVCWGYNAEDGPLCIFGTGQGHLDEVQGKGVFKNDQVVYVVLGVRPPDGDYTLTKFMLLTWVGPDVKPLHKARSSQHRVELYTFIKRHVQLQGEYQALKADDVSAQQLLEKLSLSKDRDQEALRQAAAADAAKKKAAPSTSAQSFRPESGGEFDVPWEDENSALAAVKDVGNDDTPTTWALFGYKGASKSVSVLKTGTGGIDSFMGDLADDALAYVLYSAVVPDDEYSVMKRCFISWVGVGTKAMLRARSSQHRVPLYNCINKHVALAAELQVLNRDELSEEAVHSKFTGSKYADAPAEKLAAPQQRTRTASSKAAGESGLGFAFTDEAAARKEIAGLHASDLSSAGKWICFGCKQGERDVLEITGTGSNGLVGFKGTLKDEDYNFIILAVECPDECGGDYSIVKNLFIAWVGPDVKPLTKARSSQQRVALYNFAKKLLQMHGELQVQSQEELTEKDVVQKLAYSRQA